MNEVDMTVMMCLNVSINAIFKERYRSESPIRLFPWLPYFGFPCLCVAVSRVNIDFH